MNSQNKFTVVSTFSGCGGSSLGYTLAGGKVRLAVEWDDNAVETYRLNFPKTPIYHGDITKLSAEKCLEISGLRPGELDIFDGSPPCQGFSTAGRRDFNDNRNQLFREYVRLLRGLQPKCFVMENVSGMVKGAMKLIFAECLKELKSSGYQVKARLLNAKFFNVPQSRERMIFIGVRNDIGIEPSHPKAQTKPITIREVCPNIGSIVLGPHGSYQGRIVDAETEPSPTICKTGLPSFIHRVIAVGKAPPKPSELKTQRWAITVKGKKHPERFSLHRLDWNSVAPTINKTATGSTGIMHPDEPRELTEFELKRIASFPDEYQFAGKWVDVLARIGNSVPPNLMKAIAEHINTTILSSLTPVEKQ